MWCVRWWGQNRDRERLADGSPTTTIKRTAPLNDSPLERLVLGLQPSAILCGIVPLVRTDECPDQYNVVFDFTRNGSERWFPAFGLVFVLIGGFLTWLGRGNRGPFNRRFLGYAMAGFACLWSLLVLSKMIPDYQRARSAYLSGNYSVVQGLVTDFQPMPYQGHGEECFTVDSETFCYSDYVVTLGFNNTASHGGPIREGLPVRVSFIGNTILRLEVRTDALASLPEREAFARASRSDWQKRREQDPMLDRMTLGFAIAVLFFCGWWNVQPKRFMRFWLRPPYKPLTVTIFRIFFAANLLSALVFLVQQIARHQRPLANYEIAMAIAAAWLFFIVLMVMLIERLGRRQILASHQEE